MWALAAALALAGESARAAEPGPCRLKGVPHEALCGSVARALDPARPDGPTIEVHFAVLPALARNKRPDPVFIFAGGPGQSAIELAGPLAAQLARFSNRRDLVFIDQRGTGRSAPLKCEEPGEALRPLSESIDPGQQRRRLAECRTRLVQLPHGDLRQYTTSIAMADAEAVRIALRAPQINAIGASYGTRAVLEYMRQFPGAVRRAVIDGVAPADMVLPASFSTDNQAALDGLFAWCARDGVCNARHPHLAVQWQALLNQMPREVLLAHPMTGREERVPLTRDALLGMVRGPLYAPALAAALPQAIADAAAGRFAPLLGLSTALRGAAGLYAGMHFSVVCAEDLPRLAQSRDAPGRDFGLSFGQLYEQVCADWPRGSVSEAFYSMTAAPVATLVLSGGADPATPPRHGERVARALGVKARHTVVQHAGHGVMALPCLNEAVFRFIDAASDSEALKVDQDCAKGVPRPPAYAPLAARAASGVAR
jgi:pimeloyl-ACP methyl ester carboxylesterase